MGSDRGDKLAYLPWRNQTDVDYIYPWGEHEYVRVAAAASRGPAVDANPLEAAAPPGTAGGRERPRRRQRLRQSTSPPPATGTTGSTGPPPTFLRLRLLGRYPVLRYCSQGNLTAANFAVDRTLTSAQIRSIYALHCFEDRYVFIGLCVPPGSSSLRGGGKTLPLPPPALPPTYPFYLVAHPSPPGSPPGSPPCSLPHPSLPRSAAV